MPQVAATAAGLYVAWQVSRPGSVVRSELARVDAATGRVEAARYLGAAFEQAVLAAGALWVATAIGSFSAAQTLLRLNPDTLEVTGRWRVGTGGERLGVAHLLVVAGGGLWVAGGNRLLHLSLPDGTITASIALRGAASSDLSANAAGTVLVVGEAASGGRGAVQRRDPVTGALLASFPMMGVTAPTVAGPVGSAVWVSEASGMMGYVQRLDAATMTAQGSACQEGGTTSTCVEGTNDVTASLAGGLLWVTQIAGGPPATTAPTRSLAGRSRPFNSPSQPKTRSSPSRRTGSTTPRPAPGPASICARRPSRAPAGHADPAVGYEVRIAMLTGNELAAGMGDGAWSRLMRRRPQALMRQPPAYDRGQGWAARRDRPSTKMSMRSSKRSSGLAKANSSARAVMLGNSAAGSAAM